MSEKNTKMFRIKVSNTKKVNKKINKKTLQQTKRKFSIF